MDAIRRCEELLKYKFDKKSLLDRALTHSSVKSSTRPSNERLEFLGDAVLGLTISEHLFLLFPDYNEGDLTQMKSVIVSAATLARVVKQMGFEQCVSVGKGILNRKSMPRSIMANLYEAMVAAVYLDGGFEVARQFILESLEGEIEDVIDNKHDKNYKSILQQLVQREHTTTPDYRVISEEGPDHMKTFKIVAVVNGQRFEPASGRSKKQAEQNAAKEALKALEAIEINESQAAG